MEIYPLAYQFEMDIFWYLLDSQDRINQFSSAGSILPDFIANNAADNELLQVYFGGLPLTTQSIINPFIEKYSPLKSLISPVPTYGDDAKRGLICFDKLNPCPGDYDIAYYLVASPQEYLTIDKVPPEIRSVLLKYQKDICLSDFYKIDHSYKPWNDLFSNNSIPIEVCNQERRKRFWFF